jgi:cobyric acid synthase
MKCLGVLPFLDIRLPEEDSGEGPGSYTNAQIDAFVSILDAVLEEARKHLDMEEILKIATG